MFAKLLVQIALFVVVVISFAAPGTGLAVHRPSLASGAHRHNQTGGANRAGENQRDTGGLANPWVLSNTNYAPLNFTQQPFVGNGYLGLRLPAIGAGYQGENLGKSGFPLFNGRYTSALVAGVYENAAYHNAPKQDYISSLPTWSEIDLTVDGQTLNSDVPASQISSYRQRVDMRTAVVTTSFLWTPSPGKATAVTYQVLANREHMHLGQIRLTLKPSWTGQLVLTTLLNGRGAERITATSRKISTATDTSTVMLQTPGRNTSVAETQLLVAGPGVQVVRRSAVKPSRDNATAGEQWTLEVTAGKTYQITKYVGISTSNDPGAPADVALNSVRMAEHLGWQPLLAAHTVAWDQLWAHRVSVAGHYNLQASINSSFYLLYSSIRAGLAWSIAPAGLSSDNYGGEIFWDADTWMFPTLLAFHPELAKSIVDFRYNTRSAAEANAANAGYKGGSWAWDDGPTGACGGLAPCSHYEDHLQSEIALAQWQYYEVTGDRQWLAQRGYPVIKDVADFWISRVKLGSDGKYHILDATGPDEFTAHVNDESATNAGAVVALRDAVAAAKAIGQPPNPQWTKVADNIYVPVDPDGTHPEYAGYTNQTIKQADTVLMTYPLGYVTNPAIAAADLNRYMPVTDPGGPAMTVSVEGIIAAQVHPPGCLDYTLLQNSYLPYMRGAYNQFLETQYLVPSARQGHPTFDFATGAGGFLQMFPYGFAGLRWSPSTPSIAPTLPPQLSQGITLHGIRYHGRSLTIAIGPHFTFVSLTSGAPLKIATPTGDRTVQPGQPLRLPTERPDLDPTSNLARCRPATASSSETLDPPEAAVDGNTVTMWKATSTTSTYQVSLLNTPHDHAPADTAQATIVWGPTRPAHYTVSILTAPGQWRQVDSGPVPPTGDLQAHWAKVKSLAIRFAFSGGSAASTTRLTVPVTPNAPGKIAD